MNDSWTEIDLGVLRSNLAALRAALAPSTDLIAMLKADAYGHGLDLVGPEAWRSGIRRFAVFHAAEALQLRRLLPQAAILWLGVAEPDDVPLILEARLEPLLVSSNQARGLALEAARLGSVVTGQAKIDTGMGRLGFAWETAAAELTALAALPGLRLAGAGTHLACAGSDPAFTALQMTRFNQALEDCRRAGLAIPFRHAANSAGLCGSPEWRLDAVRPGILLYGYGPPSPGAPPTRPFLQWKTRVAQVKSVPAGFRVSYDSTYVTPRATRIATLPAGYSDGYSRAWSNRGEILAGGRRARLAGRVTMNLIMADLGPDSPVQAGDEAVLLGEQGGASIWADELAALSGTISYEVLTSIRSPRRAVEGAHG
jgi:alanine racemase